MVYNLLPEIVARLPEHVEDGVEGGAVARVQYIMQFVEKETGNKWMALMSLNQHMEDIS